MSRKNTMNSIQRDYIAAKAFAEVVAERIANIERSYIAAHGIKNDDGSIPERVYCIDDLDVFDKANEETEAEIKAAGLDKTMDLAAKELREAEDALISYGISLAPPSIRATLAQGVKKSADTRKKMIDMTFRLDVSTVPPRA